MTLRSYKLSWLPKFRHKEKSWLKTIFIHVASIFKHNEQKKKIVGNSILGSPSRQVIGRGERRGDQVTIYIGYALHQFSENMLL